MPRKFRRINALTSYPIGNWDGVIKFFDKMGIEMKKKIVKAQWDSMKNLKNIVIGHILAQDLNWEKLSPRTERRKKKNKSLIYIDTELYLNSIKIWKKGNTTFVGVKKGIVYKRNSGRVSLERVAIWMEYGTKNMPARPLWTPSIEEVGGPKGIRDFVAAAIYRRLKWLARGTPIKVTQKQISNMAR